MFKLNLLAPINDLGYGVYARGIIKGLSEIGYDDYRLSVIGRREGELSAQEIPILNKLEKGVWYREAPCVKIWHEYQMNDLSGYKLIACPFFETTKLFPKAIHDLKQMDSVFVTSQWAKNVVEQNIGNDTPVYVVNGAGQEFDFDEDFEKFSVFTFTHVGKFEYRKCTEEIIKCYIDCFENKKEDTRLIVHCFNPFDGNFINNTAQVLMNLGLQLLPTATDGRKLIAMRGNAVVEIPKVKLAKQDLYALYKCSHIGVFPSRGEGWNLELFESIVNGLPCIASYATAHTEYVNTDLNYPQDLLLFNGKEEIASDGRWFNGNRGNWISPDLNELREKMLYCYTNYDNIMRTFDNTKIKEKFTWKNSAKQFVNALSETMRRGLEINE